MKKTLFYSFIQQVISALLTIAIALGAVLSVNVPKVYACYTWQVGQRVGLKGGAEIREGSGLGYPVHTIVPNDNWQVDIIGGPRYADGEEWCDISRAQMGNIYVESGLELQPDPSHDWPPVEGDKLIGRFTLGNSGGQTVHLEGYGIRMRRNNNPDDYWDFLYPGSGVDLAPGQTVRFDQNNERPLETGHYRAEITWKVSGQDWQVFDGQEFDVAPRPGNIYIESGLELQPDPNHDWPPVEGDKLIGRFTLGNNGGQTVHLEGYGVRMRRNNNPDDYWDFLYPGGGVDLAPGQTVRFDQNNERPLETGHYRAEITWKVSGQDWQVSDAQEFDVVVPGQLELVDDLSLRSDGSGAWPPRVGDKLIAHIRVRNAGDQSLHVEHIGVRGRRNGSENWDIGFWTIDLGGHQEWSLDPNNERPLQEGSYSFRISYSLDGSNWTEIGNEVNFTVSPPPDPYSISGRVRDENDAPILGVTISDDAGHTATTNSNGNYTLGGLTDGTYTLTPSKSGWTFTPSTRTVSVPPDATAQDFTGFVDTTSPAAITDLAASTGSAAGTVNLSWTAPGDDDNIGTASTYIVRYADSAIGSDLGWAAAVDVDGEPTPQVAGSSESMTVSGLTPGQTYYFMIRAEDEVPNLGGLGNSPSTVAGEGPTYSISGRVTDNAGNRITGVKMEYDRGEAFTNDNGEYNITDLTADTYTLTPSKTGWTFTPATRTVSVPPSATGQDFTGGHLWIDSGFRPNRDGYTFSNRDPGWGRYPLPPADVDYTTVDMRQMFRDDDCVCHMVGPVCFVKWHARRWNDLANRLMSNEGHCLGMAVTSLRLFRGVDGEEPSDFQGGANATYDLRLGSARRYISYYWMTQLTNPIRASIDEELEGTPSQVLDRLLPAMSPGTTHPMVLLIRNENGTAGHAVTPFFVQHRGNGVYWVRVYDNNDPGDFTRYLTIDTTNDTWSYEFDVDVIWSGQTYSQTLGAVPISVFAQQPDCPEWDTAADQLLNWLSGNSHLLITDSRGRRIGFAGDQFLSEIPGASSYVPSGGLGIPVEPIYTLPLTETYAILLDGQTLTQTETVEVTQFGPGYAAWVGDVTLEPTSQDRLTIAPDGRQLGYQASSTKEATLTLAMDGVGESNQLQINGADIGAGQVVTLTADVGNGQLVFNNAQTSGGEYDLEINRLSAAGERRFAHASLAISATDTHYVDYGAWDGSGPMTLYVDHGSDGTIDETWLLDNQAPRARPIYLPIIMKHQVSGPDLVLDSLVATSDAVTVTIKNQGNVPVTDEFWVDVYFNPTETPRINKPWDTIASHGVVWGVTTPIAANGGTLMLTTGDTYYVPEYSSTPPLPVGANVYALVDSINYDTTYGVVQESNEDNNLFGPVTSTAGVAGEAVPVGHQGQPPSMEGLPPRR